MMGEFDSHDQFDSHDLGTLVWIGDQAEPEFQDPFQYCLSHVAQVALRANLEEAVRRPAAGVRYILLARATRRPLDGRLLNRLTRMYPQASIVDLLGTLCEGMSLRDESTSTARRPGGTRLYWHRWNPVLPEWLRGSAASPVPTADHPGSVAVLSSTFAAGQALLELAESVGSTVVWCRGSETWRVRNVDLVWWDDSVAPPTSSGNWRKRIGVFGDGAEQPRHAWIANSPRYQQQREATDGGIEVIVSKPNRVDRLLSMLGERHEQNVAIASTKAA